MSVPSLDEVIAQHDSPVDRFKNMEIPPGDFIWTLPDEYTNWIEEQRAWRESVAFRDMSYHMENLYIEGPDAVELFSKLCVNSFEDFETDGPPQAKQIICCNSDGQMIGDQTLYYIGDERYVTTGTGIVSNWLEYNAERGAYDVSMEVGNNPFTDESPKEFRFQVQGPNAKAVLSEATDGPLPDIGGFEMDELTIDGHDFYALGHGMAGSYGLEISGPYEHHDEIKETVLEAGEGHGIRQLGSKSYLTSDLEIGWIAGYHPAIYEKEEFEEYREWLTVESLEANYGIAGSFDAEDISEYYLDPVALGYEHIVDFDHDFIGKEALRDKVANPDRTRVSFIWNDENVVDVYASLFDEGETHEYLQLPNPTVAGPVAHYDRIERDGDMVGILKEFGYLYPERSMIGVGVIDVEYADPGTDVTIVHGQEQSNRPSVERHSNKNVRATVQPSPLYKNRE